MSPILLSSSGGILLIAYLTPKKHVPMEVTNKNSEAPRNIRDDFLMTHALRTSFLISESEFDCKRSGIVGLTEMSNVVYGTDTNVRAWVDNASHHLFH